MARDFTTGKPMSTIFMFAVPMLIGQIFQQLYSTVDTIVVGNYEGASAIAAVSASTAIQFLLVSIAMGFTSGMSVVISQVYGARDYEKMKRVFTTGFIFVTALAFVLAIVGSLITEPVLVAMGTDDSILAGSVTYLRIMFLGMPFQFVYNMYASVLRAVGDSKTPLYFLIVAAVTNIVLDIVFVANFRMGVAGVAWATLISQAFSGFLCHIYVDKKVPMFKIGKGEWKLEKDLLKPIISYGLPASIQQSVVSLGMLFVQTQINFFGPNMTAAYGVSNRIQSFATMPQMQLAMALSMFAGQNIGAGEEQRAKEGIKATMFMQLVYAIAMGFLLPIIAPTLIRLFGLGDDATVLGLATMGLSFMAKFVWLFGMFQALNQFHRGVGDTKFSMVASLCLVLVRVPITYFMVHVAQLGEISIWAGMCTGWAVAFTLNAIRFLTGGWRGKAYVQGRVDKKKEAEA